MDAERSEILTTVSIEAGEAVGMKPFSKTNPSAPCSNTAATTSTDARTMMQTPQVSPAELKPFFSY